MISCDLLTLIRTHSLIQPLAMYLVTLQNNLIIIINVSIGSLQVQGLSRIIGVSSGYDILVPGGLSPNEWCRLDAEGHGSVKVFTQIPIIVLVAAYG